MPEDDVDRERLARRWELVAAHRERLLRLARSRSASDADAEDAVQETLLRSVLFENLDEDRVGPFLTTVTARICADRHRANNVSDRLHQRLGSRLVDDESPEDLVCDDAEARAVADVVATLPKRQQSVVRARSIGLSCGEVAHHLGLTYSAVESALSRARATVRARVDVCLDATALAGARLSRVLRWVPAELPGATAAAVGGLLAGTLAVTPAAPAALAATPPVARVHVVAARQVVPPPARVRTATPAQVTRALPKIPPVPVPVAVSVPHVRPTLPPVHVGRVHAGDNHDGYTFNDRLGHCIDNGLVLTYPVHCRYPDEPPSTP